MRRPKSYSLVSVILAAVIWLPVPLSAQVSNTDKLESMEATGTVGQYRIGMNYTVREHSELVEAHYFYMSQSKNIPLTGVVSGESVHLHGADGSDFTLHSLATGATARSL